MEGLRESLGRLLLKVRSEQRLTLLEVDELTAQQGHRVPRARLSLLERGEAPIRFEDLMGLSRAYGFALVDLCAEAIAARPPERFAGVLSAEQAFEEGKTLFHRGSIHEAGWAFDVAAEIAGEANRELAGLARTSACHAYDRLGARHLAMRRIEQALDTLDETSDASLRAVGKMSVLLASSGARARTRIYMNAAFAALDDGVSPQMEAYLLGTSASALHLLHDMDAAIEYSLRSARLYRQLGQVDMCALKLAAAATYFARQRKLQQALRYVRDAEGLLAEMERVDASLFVLLALGEVLSVNGTMEEARQQLERAFHLASAHELTTRVREAVTLLERLATTCGDDVERRRWRSRLKKLSGSSLGELFDGVPSQDGHISGPGRTP